MVKEPGTGFDHELILPTRQVWKAVFENPSIKLARITVEGPVENAGAQKTTGKIYSLDCTGEDAGKINRDEVETAQETLQLQQGKSNEARN